MEKRVQDYTSEILEVVKSNASPAVLCQRLQDYHENDIADILEKLSPAERCKLYRILDMDTISDIFEYTEEADVVKYLGNEYPKSRCNFIKNGYKCIIRCFAAV